MPYLKIIIAMRKALLFLFLCVPLAGAMDAMPAEDTAGLNGTVILSNSRNPIHAASVTILQLDRSVMTDENGRYEFAGIPPGTYDVVSHMHELTSQIRKIEAVSGQNLTVDFELSMIPIRYEITVTSSGREVTPFDSFQAVSTVDTIQLTEQSAFGLGDIVGNESGVHKRSFGPGSSRPVVRGFDGDRVLILNDSLPTGTISAQSGEHAEPVDSVRLDRIEMVKGPAALLYGGGAIGGVVNMVTEHHLRHEHPHPGLRGELTMLGGTNNNQAAAHVNAEYGFHNWLVWGSGSRQVANDYFSAEGRVDNSKTRMTSGSAGFGWFADKPFFNLSYAFNDGRLGIPFAGEFHHHDEGEEEEGNEEETAAIVDETFTWQNVRVNTGMRGLHSFFEELKIAANFSRWMHKELENEQPATSFDNKLVNVRTTLTQRTRESLSGTSGFQFFHRDYEAEGEEALSPPVTANGFALFTLQEMDLKSFRLQFGGRFDHTAYTPLGLPHRSLRRFLGGGRNSHPPLGRRRLCRQLYPLVPHTRDRGVVQLWTAHRKPCV